MKTIRPFNSDIHIITQSVELKARGWGLVTLVALALIFVAAKSQHWI